MEFEPCIGTTFDYSIPLYRMLELIHDAGFDYISIGMKLDHSHYHTVDGRQNLRQLRDRFDLKIDSIHANYIHDNADIASLDDDYRERGVQDFKQVVDAASELDSHNVVFHPHGWYNLKENPEKRIDAVTRSVEALIAHAKEKNVKLAVENLYNEGSVNILSALFDRFSPDDLGFCYDSSHDNITPDSEFGKLFVKHSNRLTATHLSDNLAEHDDHMIPYTGKVDFGFLASNFPRDNYKGTILLETEIRNHEELIDFPEEFLRQSFDAAMRIRKKIYEGVNS